MSARVIVSHSELVRRAAVAGLLLAPALAASDAKVREYLDEATAVTVTYAAQPLLFARDHPELGVNVREYLSLAPIAINNAGRRTYFLFGYAWCTGPMPPDLLAEFEKRLVLVGDDRRIPLRPGVMMREVGLARLPWAPPAPGARPLLFSIDPEVLRYLAHSGMLTADMPLPGAEPVMQLRRDGREQIRAFIAAAVD
jgi:hypothetical protein